MQLMDDSDIMSDEFVPERKHASIKLAKRTNKDALQLSSDKVAPASSHDM